MNIETVERLAKVQTQLTDNYTSMVRSNKEFSAYSPTTSMAKSIEDIANQISKETSAVLA